MRIVLSVFADFEQAIFGPSHLERDLVGTSVLDRTLARCAAVQGVRGCYLVVQERDADRAQGYVARHAGFELLPCDSGSRPRRRLLGAARKWNLDAWRGGLLGATWFDENFDPFEIANVLNATQADAVVCIDGHQPCLDPALVSGAVQTQIERITETQFIFDQAPPGLSGLVLTRESVRQLAESQTPFGIQLAYRPEAPRMDLITKPMCRKIDSAVAQTQARFLADRAVSIARLEGAIHAGQADSAEALCAWARANPLQHATLPQEVELELTTDDPLPETTVRARGARVPTRVLADVGAVERIAAELGGHDDRLVWLGGHGDPLQHPAFEEVCGLLRAGGMFGIGVATPLVDLTDAQIEAMFAAPLDVIEVQLDAHTPATYQRVHGRDAFEQAVRNLARLQETRQQRLAPRPIVTASMVRCAETFTEMEAFFDHWIQHVGWAILHGYAEKDGLLPADVLPGTTPPIRSGCRRIQSRLMLLADGRAISCSEDPLGRQELGRWDSDALAAIWGGAGRKTLLTAHEGGSWGTLPVCDGCNSWHVA